VARLTKDKTRLDIEMVNRGLVDTRSKAQAVILLGAVYVNNQKIEKAGYAITPSDIVEFRDKRLPYVSRGGLKLAEAIKTWEIDCSGKLCCDIGASTGGFTDCLLQNGASTVHAIDVGHSQLAWKLRQNERVVVYEKLNARYIEPDSFPKFDIIVMDVSFISIT
jgi:23S rRNA (cytidine1920-2'-O)/16S rRNA (cytidine1409-2'-O)-methyltransferase